MLSKAEIENSIEYKFNNFYNEETYKLTIEEAKYVFSGENNFCDAIIVAGAEILLQYIDQLETDNYEVNNRLNDYIEERHNLIDNESR